MEEKISCFQPVITLNLYGMMKQLHDFDLSIIVPFYKRMEEFKRVFPGKAPYFQRNGIEVIIVADEPSEQDALLSYIRHYPLINWKLIVNHNDHPWRNPAKALNVGIRMASQKYILVMDPELECFTDVVYILRKHLDSYPEHFAVGQVVFTNLEQKITDRNIDQFEMLPYGSIMVQKQHLEAIEGFNEGYTIWGGEDDNIRKRLELFGVKKLFYPEAILIHRENFSLRTTSRTEQRNRIPRELLCDMLIPQRIVENNGRWGNDFDAITFDWKKNPWAAQQCREYLSELKDYRIPDDYAFDRRYKLIALIPAYNEASRIEECIQSVEKHCDGIILLDDDSSDLTYSLAQSEKLLLKTKKIRTSFDDKQNRNILLDIASFFSSEWFIFIDADELFDERFVDLPGVTDLPVDIVGLWIANLWDNPAQFRVNMTDTHPYSQNGIWFRWRMFRNKGRMQFIQNNKLHFSSVPYKNNLHVCQTLLLHSGYLDKNKREQKYSFYVREDEEQIEYYSNILSKDVEVKPLTDITKDYFIFKTLNKTQL